MLRFKSDNLPESNLISVYEINPMAMPSAIEKVKGIIMAVITTGADSLKSFQAIFLNDDIINTATNNKAGAVAYVGIMAAIGETNKANKNNTAVVTAVSPVLPPETTPAALSI